MLECKTYFAGLIFFALCLFCRDNFLNVDVYFAQLKYQSVMQIKAYDLVQFMGTHFQSHWHRYLLHSCAIVAMERRNSDISCQISMSITLGLSSSVFLKSQYWSRKYEKLLVNKLQKYYDKEQAF